MKKIFMTPELRVVKIENNDIICGSGGNSIGIGIGPGSGNAGARGGFEDWDDEDF